MSLTVIEHAAVVLPGCIEEDCSVAIDGGKIAEISAANELGCPSPEQTIDAGGLYLAPGFIDMHIHGLEKFLIDNGCDDLAEICRLLPKYGVTSFLPSVCPHSKGEDAEFLASLAKVKSESAAILGFHLEGPFLSITGALPPEALGQADPGRVKALIESAKPYQAVFSISPEFEGITDLIKIMSADNALVFITHTKADVKQTQAAIQAGARHATHFYDVFYPPDETDPGVRPCGAVEAILADERVSVDFILDGEHVDPIAVKMALYCKGPDRVCLITDANVGAGLGPGKYQFGKEEVEFKYEGGPARMVGNSRSPGGLAGSGLTMDMALRNAMAMLDIGLPLAVRMTSLNPAAVLGIDNRKGQIKEGFDADMVLLDKNLQIRQTWIGGKCVFSSND